MRQSRPAELRYWSNNFPLDLLAGAKYGALAAVLAAPLAYLAALRYFGSAHTLEQGSHRSAAVLLSLFAAVVSFFWTAIPVFLFRYFRRLYRDPL
jgi:hypothetical protein